MERYFSSVELQLPDLQKIQLDRRFPAEDRDQDLDFALFLVNRVN